MSKRTVQQYIIHKADGSPVDPLAEYFVLRLDNDPIACESALMYARLIGASNPQMSREVSHAAVTHLTRLYKNLTDITITKPKIICCVGSNKYGLQYNQANQMCVQEGAIMITTGCDLIEDEDFDQTEEGELAKLVELNKHKIELADSIIVLNPEGVVGAGTQAEVTYAMQLGKPIKYWIPPVVLS